LKLEKEWRAALSAVRKEERRWYREHDRLMAAHPEWRYGPGEQFKYPVDMPADARRAYNKAVVAIGGRNEHELIPQLTDVVQRVYDTPAQGYEGLRVKFRVFIDDYAGDVIERVDLDVLARDVRRLAARARA
jgi:hypothetical protein